MKKNIEIIARGVCVKSGHVLLCHSRGARNTYLPGGHVEFGESARESLKREIKEEMGRGCRVGRFLGAVEHKFVQKGRSHCEINLVFELSIPGIRVKIDPKSCEDYIEFLWAPMSALRKARCEPSVLCRVLPAWWKGRGKTDNWAGTY